MDDALLIQILTNTKGARWRKAKLEGRDHIVVPTVMLLEGVFNGSEGPVFYSGEELGRDVRSWNHRPVVVYHPSMNGKAISACTQEVLNTQKVGITLNTSYKNKILRTESWLDVERCNAVDSRILQSVMNGKSVEVSTGLFVNKVTGEPAKYNGKEYTVSAVNHKPDHLAILPDEVGSCSIKDGAGLLVNAEGIVIAEESELTVNEVARECEASQDRYLAIAGKPFRNPGEEKMAFDKKKHVDDLIANTASGYIEADREELMKMGETTLQKIKAIPLVVNTSPPVVPPVPPPPPVPPVAQPVAQQSVEEYIRNAPPGVGEVLVDALNHRETEKAQLVATIIANKKNAFSEAYLKEQKLDVLRGIARLCDPAPVAGGTPILNQNWAGAAGANPGVSTNYPAPPILPTPVANHRKPVVSADKK